MTIKVKGKDGAVVPLQSFASLTPPAEKTPDHDLDLIVAGIVGKKGKGVILKGIEIPDPIRIPSGIFELDLALGGGFPLDRMSMVYGPEGSGKTLLMLRVIAFVQQHFPEGRNKCAIVDIEGTFIRSWAEMLGVDCEKLLVVKPAYGEEAVDIVDALMRADDIAFIGVDSVAVLTPQKEIDQSVETALVGSPAILVKRMSNKIAIALALEARRGHHLHVMCINQTRFKISSYGGGETVPGGNTIRFISSLTIRLKGSDMMDGKIHNKLPAFKDTEVEIKKAKVGITSKTASYKLALLPQDDLMPGETDSWNTVSSHLKSSGHILKLEPKGWKFQDQVYPTLVPIHDRYVQDSLFRHQLQKMVIESIGTTKVLVEVKKDANGEEVLD